MGDLFIPAGCRVVDVIPTEVANADSTGDRISMKNIKKLWFVIYLMGTGGTTSSVITLSESSDVAGTGAASLTRDDVPNWLNTDTATSDTLTRQTDLTNGAMTIANASQKNQIGIIEWEPSKHASGLDCITVVASGGHASNYITVLALCDMKYKEESGPTVITD